MVGDAARNPMRTPCWTCAGFDLSQWDQRVSSVTSISCRPTAASHHPGMAISRTLRRRPRPRQQGRRLYPELDKLTATAMKAIGDHLRIGPGYGMAGLIDLRWRIGNALSPEGKTRMPYKSVLTRALAERLSEALGKGFSSTMIFDARRFILAYPRRTDIPRFVMWSKLRPFVRKDPPRGQPQETAGLRRPGLIELRRLAKRAIQLWKMNWLALPCQHPSALLYRDGKVIVMVRIIQPKLRYMPLPEVDDQASSVIEMRWSERPVIRCLKKHAEHSQINIKDLRRCILDP